MTSFTSCDTQGSEWSWDGQQKALCCSSQKERGKKESGSSGSSTGKAIEEIKIGIQLVFTVV